MQRHFVGTYEPLECVIACESQESKGPVPVHEISIEQVRVRLRRNAVNLKNIAQVVELSMNIPANRYVLPRPH